jgi:hypothetical protein
MHDTRHDDLIYSPGMLANLIVPSALLNLRTKATRLPVLTEVDGSMAPLEELDDSTKRTRRLARGRFVVKLFDPYYKH